ncbi:hypothetical protein [Streptomyces bohaiensis]|nr:hypothetical protein [Streptomyces bohaiensis]
MNDINEATMVTYTTAGRTELPATIDGIRAALPESEREEFTAEAGRTPAGELPRVLARWALRTDQQAVQDAEAQYARLAAGDFSDCVAQDDPEAGAA